VSGSFAVVVGAEPSCGREMWVRVRRDGDGGQCASLGSCVARVAMSRNEGCRDVTADLVGRRKMWKERRERPSGMDGPIRPWLALVTS